MINRTVALVSAILGLIILISLVTWAVVQTGTASLSEAIPYSLSVLSFFISILSSFREELFPFQLKVYADTPILVAGETMPPATGISIFVLLPLIFSNSGYSEGVVQSIKLVVKGEKNKTQHEFLSAFEIDMAKFMQQMKGINATNTIGNVIGFALEPKKPVRKDFVFSAKVDAKKTPVVWQPDTYTFELYVRVYGSKDFRKYFEVKQEIAPNALSMLMTGKSKAVYFINNS